MFEIQQITDEELQWLEEYRIQKAEPCITSNDHVGQMTKEEFLAIPMDLEQDQDKPINSEPTGRINTRGREETDWLREKFPQYDSNRNAIWFKPGTWMDWHTNSADPGERTYYIYNRGEGCFRMFDGENYVESWEESGWTKRVFQVPVGGVWHAVWAGDYRLSIGFAKWNVGAPTPPEPLT